MHTLKALIPIIFSIAVVASSGCVSMDPQALAMANPMIQQFLDELPNAEILITHYSVSESENILEQVRTECGNPYIGPKEFYRVHITDPDTDFEAVVWVDWEARIIECAWKLGTEGKETDNPKEDQGCEHHSFAKCKGEDLYWFDSCGNKEDLKETCPDGCSEDRNTCWGDGCKSHAEAKCYGDHIYWFDSCGNKQEKKEYCQAGCNLGFCKEDKERSCESYGGYCVYPDPVVCTDDAKVCPDGTSVGRVPPKCEFASCPGLTECPAIAKICPDGSTAKTGPNCEHICPETCGDECTGDCQDPTGAVTCTANTDCGCVSDSVTGNIHDAEVPATTASGGGSSGVDVTTNYPTCRDSYKLTDDYWCPQDGMCCLPKESPCRSQHQSRCYEGHVYWYDSCGNKESKREKCEHGCEDGACLRESDCDETDNGYDIYHAGVTESANQRYEDHCNSDGTLTEKYCEGGSINAKTVECPEGYECEEAACVLEEEDCIEEGGYMQGTVSPEYQTHCCSGLEGFDTSGGLMGAPMLCYDPQKGIPECMGELTDVEGWYYPQTEELLVEEECAEELEPFCGTSTNYDCTADEDCAAGGCSSQVCGGVQENITTTCEYLDCYDPEPFNVTCGCYEGQCMWED